MVVLYSIVNFDMVVGGGEYCVYLHCHLDWKPLKFSKSINF